MFRLLDLTFDGGTRLPDAVVPPPVHVGADEVERHGSTEYLPPDVLHLREPPVVRPEHAGEELVGLDHRLLAELRRVDAPDERPGGDREEPDRNLAEKLKVAGNIRFEGRKGNMREYYAAADLLFYPTLYEPFSNVCLEAFSCGLPVLTTALNGAAEIVTENLNGCIVPDASAEELMAGQLAKFAGFSGPERVKLSENAYKASLNFSWIKHVEQLEKVFYRVRN